jgi:L-ascorbate metabolism protein UlaG (beta-lactamase superfamily)
MRRERLLLLGSLVLSGCGGDPLVGEPEVPSLPAASVAEAFAPKPTSAPPAGERATDRFSTPKGTLSVMAIEHASFVLGWEDKAIYVDPAGRSLADATLPQADAILITDPHYDHLDPVWVSRLRQARTVVVGPEAAAARAPIDVVLHNGETRAVLGIEVRAVPSYNITRGPVAGLRYHEKGRDNGYVLDFGGLRVYVSGDTDCTPEIEALERIDIAFIGMNVPYAMTPTEASTCIAAFHPSVVIPYAYRHADMSTFDLAKIAPSVELRRLNFYLPVDMLRQHAYQVFSQGMWGWADDLLDLAKVRDPQGDADWRVQMTRRWLREYERQWPF